MLDYLVKGRVRRELLQLIWGEDRSGSVSELARAAKVNFSAAHRELEAMRGAGLVATERRGATLHYRQAERHPQAALLRQLTRTRNNGNARVDPRHDAHEKLRGWLTQLGAPLRAAKAKSGMPGVEDVLSQALVLSHTDAAVARTMPLVLWRQRDAMDLGQLVELATKRNERQALGYFLELAGRLGKVRPLVNASKQLVDRRRRRPRMFFPETHGRRALAAAQRRTPALARRWGYLMNTGEDSFRSLFDKFAAK